MTRQHIPDHAIDLEKKDYLKTKYYSENLRKIIERVHSGPCFAVGIFGKWGSGKSSIIETCANSYKSTGVKFIHFDAWQHIKDSFRRKLLIKLARELNYDEKKLVKQLYRNQQQESGFTITASPLRITIVIIVFLLFFFFLFNGTLSIEKGGNQITSDRLLTMMSVTAMLLLFVFSELKSSIIQPYAFASEQFEDLFIEILQKYRHSKSKDHNTQKIVIVIDNIDRCTSAISFELLTDIRTFLSTEVKDVIFLIPVDEDSLKAQIASSLQPSGTPDLNTDEYYRKIFNVIIRIKPFRHEEIHHFAIQLNTEYGLMFRPDTLKLMSKEFITNPRQIIHNLNNLSSELDGYSDEFAKENEVLICAVLILKDYFKQFYQQLLREPNRIVTGNVEGINSMGVEDKNRTQQFLASIKQYVGLINLKSLSQILSNDERVFDGSALLTRSTDELLALYNDYSDRASNIIAHRIINCIRTDDILSLENIFYAVAELNEKHELPAEANRQFDDEFSSKYSILVLNVSNANLLCSYANRLYQIGIYSLWDSIQIGLSSMKAKKESHYKYLALLEASLSNFRDQSSSLILSPFFESSYDEIDIQVSFSQDQWDFLISDRAYMDEISKVLIGKYDFRKLRFLTEFLINKKYCSSILAEFMYERVLELGSSKLQVEDHQISTFAVLANRFLESHNNTVESSNNIRALDLYNFLLYNKDIVYSNNKYIKDEFESKNRLKLICEYASPQICISLLFKLYKLSPTNIDINDNLISLSASVDIINKELLLLVSQGKDISTFCKYIFSLTDFKNEYSLLLIRSVFEWDSKKLPFNCSNDASKVVSLLLKEAQRKKTMALTTVLESFLYHDILRQKLKNEIARFDMLFIDEDDCRILGAMKEDFSEKTYLKYIGRLKLLEYFSSRGDKEQMFLLLKCVASMLSIEPMIDENIEILDQSVFDKLLLLIKSQALANTKLKTIISSVETRVNYIFQNPNDNNFYESYDYDLDMELPF